MGKRGYTQEELERLEQLRLEEANEPMRWFPHDTDAFDDPKIRKLMRRFGYAGYGMWWRVCELMGKAEGHGLEVSGDDSWDDLAYDMRVSVPECREFVSALVELGLISRDSFEGFGTVRSERLQKEAMRFVKTRAYQRLAGEITARNRWKIKTEEDGEGE